MTPQTTDTTQAGEGMRPGTPLPWDHMAGMPTNVLGYNGCRVARCDFDGDMIHPDTLANARYIVHACNAFPALVEALGDAVDWMHDPNADKTEEWERIASLFHAETGYLRPGKSWPLGTLPPTDLDEVFRKWCEDRTVRVIAEAREALKAARGEQ